MSKQSYLYIFLDEGGNFDFSPCGTRYFTMSVVSMTRPFEFTTPLDSLKHDCIEGGLDLEGFHASDDRQHVRDRVFAIIAPYLGALAIDSVIVEKAKVKPTIYDPVRFYPELLRHFLKGIINRSNLSEHAGLVVITDALPVSKYRKGVQKAIQQSMASTMKLLGKPYHILHHDSKSSAGLQVADYCNWAIYRKWDRQDERSYDLIKRAVRTETDLLSFRSERFY